MKARLSILVAILVVAGFGTLPSHAATTVPPTVQINDPKGDANYLNDQGLSSFIGPQGDNPGGASIGAADLLAIWFTNTTDTISLHIQTAEPAPDAQLALLDRVVANPAPPAAGCLWFEATIPSMTYKGDPMATVENTCSKSGKIKGELALETLPDGTGVATLTFPISALPDFAIGSTIAAPVAQSRNLSGATGVAGPTAPQIDNTKPGTDYVITQPEVAPTP
ncbi:MAG: hypothetical protein M3290_05495, partial [Actinomycetota bacterium]|nr:hypothetical protein [Actinomycetota bacterium]